MNKKTSSNTSYLLDRYGPLMRMEDLADLLSRSRDGLRISLSADPDFAELLGKIRIGRRIYVRTIKVANMLDAN